MLKSVLFLICDVTNAFFSNILFSMNRRLTTWWGLNLIEKKSSRIADSEDFFSIKFKPHQVVGLVFMLNKILLKTHLWRHKLEKGPISTPAISSYNYFLIAVKTKRLLKTCYWKTFFPKKELFMTTVMTKLKRLWFFSMHKRYDSWKGNF